MTTSSFRPINIENVPQHADIISTYSENIVFFEDKDSTIWMLDQNRKSAWDPVSLFVITDRDTRFFDDNQNDITASVFAKGMIDAVREFNLEREAFVIDMKRNTANAHPETIANLQAAANFTVQYYNFSSDAYLWHNQL